MSIHNTLIISDWSQLTNAVSNIDTSYRIFVTHILDKTVCDGTVITVYKESYNNQTNITLMTLLVQLKESYCDTITSENVIPRSQVLTYINDFGFEVLWQDVPNLTSNTVICLSSLLSLGYMYITATTEQHGSVNIGERYFTAYTTNSLETADRLLINDLPSFTGCDFSWLDTNTMYSIGLLLAN